MEIVFERMIQAFLQDGWAVADDFLSEIQQQRLRESLQARREAGRFRKAGTGKQHSYSRDEDVRGDEISWLDRRSADQVEQEFLNLIEQFVFYLNRTCFTGIREYEMHFARYPAGSFYERHLDRFLLDDRRQFSVVCYLNEDWIAADGGALRLYPESGPQEVLPLGGRIVFFSASDLEHEVLPARRDRMSLTGWLKV